MWGGLSQPCPPPSYIQRSAAQGCTVCIAVAYEAHLCKHLMPYWRLPAGLSLPVFVSLAGSPEQRTLWPCVTFFPKSDVVKSTLQTSRSAEARQRCRVAPPPPPPQSPPLQPPCPGGKQTVTSLFCWAISMRWFVLPICYKHVLALPSQYFKSVTRVYSVTFSLERRCIGCRVPFSDPRCFLW